MAGDRRGSDARAGRRRAVSPAFGVLPCVVADLLCRDEDGEADHVRLTGDRLAERWLGLLSGAALCARKPAPRLPLRTSRSRLRLVFGGLR